MPTWTEIQDFPADICITDVEISMEYSVAIRENDFSYKQEVQVFGGEKMKMRVSFKAHRPETAAILESFLLKLRGSAGVFRFGDPYHSKPAGRGIGGPIIKGSFSGGVQEVTTEGWTPNVSYQLKAGDYLQIGERLYRSLDDVHSDIDGEATILLSPSLREELTGGEEVILENPTGLFRLYKPIVKMSRTFTGQRHSTSLECVEAL